MKKNALILGGGIAGLFAALQLADLGYNVSAVTDESQIGGNFVSDPGCNSKDACIWDKSLTISACQLGDNLHVFPAVLESFILRVTNHPNIRLYKQAKLISIQGTVGNFIAGIGDVTTGQLVGEVYAGAIILSMGFGPATSLQETAKMLDIAFNDYGFVAVNQFCPVITNRSGIFAIGSGQGSLEVGETLALAGYAATLAAQIMGEAEQQPVRNEVWGDSNEDSEIRVGVFLCRGGLKNMGVDPRIVEDSIKKLDHVVFVSQDAMLCTEERMNDMQQQVKEQGINRVVVAPCIVKTNNLLFQDTMQVAGVNRMLVETACVPLRKSGNMLRVTATAIKLVAKAIGNVKAYDPLHWHAEPVIAAMLSKVPKHPNLEPLIHSKVIKFNDRQGHFVSIVESGNESQKNVRQLDHGVAALATGTVELVKLRVLN